MRLNRINFIVDMAPKGRTKRQKEPETGIPTDSNNMDGMPLQGECSLPSGM